MRLWTTLIQKRVGNDTWLGKVDMAKAYDKVKWMVLIAFLEKHDFDKSFNNLIKECISTVTYSILVNGSPCGFFPSSRSLWQGDPMSPTLFTFLTNILSRILARSKAAGTISRFKIARSNRKISHLMYADDLIIYCQANVEEENEVLIVWTCIALGLDRVSTGINRVYTSVRTQMQRYGLLYATFLTWRSAYILDLTLTILSTITSPKKLYLTEWQLSLLDGKQKTCHLLDERYLSKL